MRKLLIAVAASALLLGACKTIDPFTGEEKYGSTTKGAAIGAGAGAVIGAISGKDAQDRRKRALIGAGVGALAGGAVGAYMDKPEADLRSKCREPVVSVTRQGTTSSTTCLANHFPDRQSRHEPRSARSWTASGRF